MIRFGYLIRGADGRVHKEANPETENSAAVERRSVSIQMALLRESGMTQPVIAEAMGVLLSTVNRAHTAYDGGGIKALKPAADRRPPSART